MAPELVLEEANFEARAISPLRELGAYEALWEDPEASFKTISEKFRARPGAVPSDFVPARRAEECAVFVQEQFRKAHIDRYGVRVHGAGEYPAKLRDAAHPVELIYYQGWWDLANSRSVAVVGTRNAHARGGYTHRQLVQKLVRDRFTVVSGLAAGVDTAAHRRRSPKAGEQSPSSAPRCRTATARQRRAATDDRVGVPDHQPGTGAAIREAGLSAQSPLLPGA